MISNKYNLVLIVSAINTNNLPLSYTAIRSHFTHHQRYEQTLKTIESIKKNIPNAFIVLVEGTEIPEDMLSVFKLSVNHIHQCHVIEEVYKHINGPYKGLGEANSLLSYLQSEHYKEHTSDFETISKISGRYWIRDDFEWIMYDDKVVCNINYNNPHHPSGVNMSTMFYTIGNKIKAVFIDALNKCCQHPEINNGIALEHVLPNCMILNNIQFYQKSLMRVEGEYGPWGGYVCH